ncbi:MAG: RNA polymerase sigma factor [Acidimicrobiales bacterium]
MHRLSRRWDLVDKPKAFCRRVVYNLVVDGLRARSRRPVETLLPIDLDDIDPCSADALSATELRPVLLSALESLNLTQRAVVVLRYFDDRSEADVAELLGIPVGTVKSTAARAIAQLRSHPCLVPLFALSRTST